MVSRRKLLLGGAAGAAVVAGGGVGWWLNSDDAPKSETTEPTWTAALPPFGNAVMTRVVGGVVLVVQQTGVVAFERTTGDERWRRDTADEVKIAFSALGVGTEDAARYVRVAGDVCVIPRYNEFGLGTTAFEVLDLATGEPRYTAELDGADGMDAEVGVTTLIVRRWFDGTEKQRFTGHTLTDGEELWRRELGTFVTMPVPYSLRNQLVDVVSTGPLVLAPATDLGLFDDEPNVTVFSLADGKDVATWDYPQDSNGGLQVIGGHLVSNGNEGLLRGYDRLTGDTLWTRETLHNFDGGGVGDFSLTGDLLMDADDRGGHYRIDMRTGDLVEYPDFGGRKLLGVGDGYAALDVENAELVGLGVDGAERWKTSLRPDPEQALAARPDALLMGDGRLVVSGGLGSEQLPDQYLWVVEMATGELTVVPGGVLSGWEEGVMAAVTLDEPGVLRVWELGVG